MTRTMEEVERMLAELQADVEALKTEPGDEWPKYGGNVYVLHPGGDITPYVWNDSAIKRDCLKRGNVFRTREEAEAEDKRRLILAGIHADAKADRDERSPENIHTIYVINFLGEVVSAEPRKTSFNAPIFNTREAAEASAKKWLGGEE